MSLSDELDLGEVREKVASKTLYGFLSEQLDSWQYHY